MPRSDSSITDRVQVIDAESVSDDDSSLESAQMAEIQAYNDDLSLSSDLDDDSDSDFDPEFLLDIGVLERDNLYRNDRRRRIRRCLEEDEDPLETDSLKLIRKRVPHQQEQLPEVTETPLSPSVVKKYESALPFQVCEVPLGVALKDIIPSSMFRKQNFQVLSESLSQSDNLLEGIEKALEILSI